MKRRNMTVFWLRLSGAAMVFGLALVLAATVIGQGMEKQVIAYLQDTAVNHSYGNIFYIEINRGLAARLSRIEVVNCCLLWSPDGRQLTLVSTDYDNRAVKIYIINSDGGELRRLSTLDDSYQEFSPSWSPTGERIMFTVLHNDSGKFQFYEINIDDGSLKALGDADPTYNYPSYSPDGKHIIFSKFLNDENTVYIMNLDGSDTTQLMSLGTSFHPKWSPDGKQIVYESPRNDIGITDADGTYERWIVSSPADETNPAWSPDGKHLVFTVTQNDYPQVFIIDADGGNQRQLTNHPIAHLWPAWQP